MNDNVGTWSPATQEININLTPDAIQHINKQMQKQGSVIGIHFGVKKSGCTGYAYVVELIDKVNADDYVKKIADNLTVTVDKSSLPFVNGTTIDFVQTGMNRQFKFINPNEKNSCGCGESFGV